MKTIYHVESGKYEKWELKKEGADQATKTFETKEEAYQYGREMCDENRPSELIVHQLNGKIEDKSLYNK
ncbi:DUF2188 domain-containing protein [Alkalihalobacillus macyae]|uniref:DUF2188 domain-containing protein n=1 Tax=Guptibacillus hwajinpoensis TaxID=208199 RepID=UPI00273BC183|nr:DUF2188 domain-containing protein [Alkalihalobacillus macyae]MDP4550695.1 DUF2188 domain-containing protein [Alkalihalobacillus macyae]